MSMSDPKVNGLILAGGHSRRMGRDKSSLVYHQVNQRRHLYELLQPFCEQVWISSRAEQMEEWQDDLPYLADQYLDIGPMGGLLSALERQSQALLVLACDVPYLIAEDIQDLLTFRNPEALATLYQIPFQAYPEPLLGIWEAQALDVLQKAYSEEQYSLQKILKKQAYQVLIPREARRLQNINE